MVITTRARLTPWSTRPAWTPSPGLSFYAGLLLLIGAFFRPVLAHPHMFIDWRIDPVIQDTMFSGIRVTWRLDEGSSAYVLEEYDRNGDKVFQPNERDSIYKEAFSNLSQYHFFMKVSWAKKAMKIRRVTDFEVRAEGGRVYYSFVVPCAIGVSELTQADLLIAFDDPEYFVAFEIDGNQPRSFKIDPVTVSVTPRAKATPPSILLKIIRTQTR